MGDILINRILDLAVQIQQIPSPTFQESARAEFVTQLFRADQKLTDVQTDSAGNVLACMPGAGMGAPLVVSAHLDTVFPAETALDVRREWTRIHGPGIGDNSLGVAGLFGLLWTLKGRGVWPAGDIWFVANTGEEGLGDLRGMKALVERFGPAPRAYLVLEGMALGHIYNKAVGVQRYKISLHTPGGHSWTDYGQTSAVHELSALVTRIASITPPTQPRTTLNIGRIGGGTSINTIASDAWLELDLRSERQDALDSLVGQVKDLVESTRRQGSQVEMTPIGQRPSGGISPEHPIIQLAQACAREQGIDPVLTAGSTDANIPLSLGYPSLVLGLTRGGGAHTIHEFIETSPLADGLEHVVRFVTRLWE